MSDENNVSQEVPVHASDDKQFTCAKCGKVKDKEHGSFVYGGTTFCCEECCKKDGEKASNVCEFC